MEEASVPNSNSINVTVKFSGRSISISVSLDSTVKDLKSLLQPLTNVLPRGQKLIFKGKLLVDAMTLRQSEITNGSKIMLMASQGLHQGDGPILKDAMTRPILRANGTNKMGNQNAQVSVDKNRLERWKVTGVIALAECNLKAIPDEVWVCGPSTRVLDISKNFIKDIPTKIGSLSSMQKLLLSGNGMSDECIHWEGLKFLENLAVLSLSQNHLTTLPSELGALRSLKQLHVSNNKLNCLPVEIGFLTQLEVLKANNNRLCTLPSSIGDCNSLLEVDLSSNLLTGLPESFGNLHSLKALHLGNNGLKSLPSTLFKMCLQLSTLDIHNTEITMDILRQFDGWNDFDERRRLKHQKQLDFRVVGSAEFDECADKN
ncbi:LRR repeats and ubiquitin-like domain-containing protein At2g30105 isoform X2 [Jatropha curcas]|uniref:LRR repeats and ubiquitin-like domain-containing protein At2g30105 isoform X2 n=1 Tax=Jatropha curcas TaxID=180498 RepID=UPI0005FBC78D|nr:LRR repeats and ubiquitin-like domain-containing protein At2g30105 isoform X2 [Jatropha curcas]